MRVTGSLVNLLMAGAAGGPVPTKDMPATVLYWTDRHGATVTRVSPSGKTVWVREDTAELTSGNLLSETQVWTHTYNPRAPERAFRLNKAGAWVSGGTRLHLGTRASYRDPSF